MTDTAQPRRATCAACLRAQSACICAFARRVDADAALLVLQHPLEVANAKNSGRLLHLCVAGSMLAVGEAFEQAQLDELLCEGGRAPVLLYPPTPGDAAADMEAPAEAPPGLFAAAGGIRLVVLDATWRKSRKMLYLNPALQRLPRMALSDVPASGYRIRKAHAPHQLSTFEAAAYALAQLQGTEQVSRSLLEAFNAFVEQQASFARHA